MMETPDIPDFSEDVIGRLDGISGEEGAQAEAIKQNQDDDAEKKARAAEQEQADGWRQAVGTAKDLICSPFPEAEPVWTGERMDNLASALARCDAAYGWGGVGGLFAHPLIGLALASFPLAVGTAKAVGAARAQRLANETPMAIVSADPMGQAVTPAVAAAA